MGKAGHRHFLNNAVIGLYPEAVEERGRVQHRVGKWPGLALGWVKVLVRARHLSGTIEADGDARVQFAWTVVVMNNRIDTTIGRVGQRARLDVGVLDLHVVLAKPGPRGRYSLARGTLRPRPFALDGELVPPARSLAIEVAPRALTVLVQGKET